MAWPFAWQVCYFAVSLFRLFVYFLARLADSMLMTEVGLLVGRHRHPNAPTVLDAAACHLRPGRIRSPADTRRAGTPAGIRARLLKEGLARTAVHTIPYQYTCKLTAGPDSAPLTKTPCGDGCRPGWLGAAPSKAGEGPEEDPFFLVILENPDRDSPLSGSKEWVQAQSNQTNAGGVQSSKSSTSSESIGRFAPCPIRVVLCPSRDRRRGKAMREPAEPACACSRLVRHRNSALRGREGDGLRLVCRAMGADTAACPAPRAGFHGPKAVEEIQARTGEDAPACVNLD